MQKRLYIISPCRSEDIWRKSRSTFVLPQMSLAILAALTPSDFEIKVTDELVDDIDFNYPADLVAVSSNTTNASRAYAVSKIFREKGIKVIIGGIHPSVMPEEALLHSDSVFVGEAEGMWEKALDDFMSDRMQQIYRCEDYPDPSKIPSGYIKEIKSHGICVHGSFIFGFDNDTPDIFDSTFDFVMKNRLEAANYCKLTPFPGTRLFSELLSKGRILHQDWSKYDRFNIVFQPQNIPIHELHEKTLKIYEKTFSVNSILKRILSNIKNILPFFAINLNYRLGSKRLRIS